ncbi:hypothetical protein JW905_00975, partial [bacterium]|nr:hypothetical protein [candidate division CSSED10-310 bacterium]
QEYDLSTYADGQPAVYLRWTMGTTDSSVIYCGWNIDDVEVYYTLPCDITPTPFVPTPTATPTATPTLIPTESPTAVPTDIPTMGPTPTAPPVTPTPMPGTLHVDLLLNGTYFSPEMEFILAVRITNPYPETQPLIPFACVLDVYGMYFWYPVWTVDFNAFNMDLTHGATDMSILAFTWPETGDQEAEGLLFYAALLSEDYTALVSNLDLVEFSYGP